MSSGDSSALVGVEVPCLSCIQGEIGTLRDSICFAHRAIDSYAIVEGGSQRARLHILRPVQITRPSRLRHQRYCIPTLHLGPECGLHRLSLIYGLLSRFFNKSALRRCGAIGNLSPPIGLPAFTGQQTTQIPVQPITGTASSLPVRGCKGGEGLVRRAWGAILALLLSAFQGQRSVPSTVLLPNRLYRRIGPSRPGIKPHIGVNSYIAYTKMQAD
ncbi:hypothetical protein PCH_Pc22g27050 [Penicillium rubens Wisconsin 54-1255]|uniref:Uncharacterized protein n=1 Tax=Penicillium rubens (strain ATCC 28089 / DSM 1075 / NRRL 1951 / Wisconsin 54-1255) TaxID=500485 RepID=B6HUR2_PENRW|nr:hypothetical protein PCH_Pc22g27050 [Penicillium rubens Wisconsin 54-1255]